MPVYHFNPCNADPVFDKEGVDLPGDRTACTHAVAAARELTFHNCVIFDRDLSHDTMSVIDAAGHEILSFAVDPSRNFE